MFLYTLNGQIWNRNGLKWLGQLKLINQTLLAIPKLDKLAWKSANLVRKICGIYAYASARLLSIAP